MNELCFLHNVNINELCDDDEIMRNQKVQEIQFIKENIYKKIKIYN